MNPRTRRIAFATVAVGSLIILGLVMFGSSVVRDHVEAWRFVAERNTKTLRPHGIARLGKETAVAMEGVQSADRRWPLAAGSSLFAARGLVRRRLSCILGSQWKAVCK